MFVHYIKIWCVIVLVALVVNPARSEMKLLDFDLINSKEITITINDDIYTIATTGSDPYIYTMTINDDYDATEYNILSFDYSSPTPIQNMQLFFFNPENISENYSHNFNLPATGDSWRTHNIQLQRDCNNWRMAKAFRFDFGDLAGQTLYIKNIRLRKSLTQLSLDLSYSKDVTIEQDDDEFIISTTGNDPYIGLTSLPQNYNKNLYYQLAFEYTSTTGIYNPQFFYYGPVTISGEYSKYVADIPATTTWKTFCADLSGDKWGVYERLRLDLGNLTAKAIKIRNIRFIPLTLKPMIPLQVDFSSYTKYLEFTNQQIASWPINKSKDETIIKDQTTFHHDGIIHGAEWNPNGIYGGYALDFDGINDYVDCGNNSTLTFTDKISISAWVKIAPDASEQTLPIITKEASFLLRRTTVADGSQFSFFIFINSQWFYTKGTTVAAKNNWYNIVVTYDATGGNGNLKIYINGSVENSTTVSGNIAQNSNNLYIGKRYNNYFSGTIDEVHLYNYVLSDTEIANDYNFGKPRALAFKLKTTGNDPYFHTTQLGSYSPQIYHTLKFDYKSTETIDDLQVFYSGATESDANSTHFGQLIASPTIWKTCSIELASDNWGIFECLRVDLGNSANKNITIKHLRLVPDDLPQWHSLNQAEKNNVGMLDLTDMHGDLPLTTSSASVILTASEEWENNNDGSIGYISIVKNIHGLNPDGKYYMFYAHHNVGSGIGCAVADKITGPYVKIKDLPGQTRLDSRILIADTSISSLAHYSTPKVVWDDTEQRYNLYFHFYYNEFLASKGHQKTKLAICYDLSSFKWVDTERVVLPAGSPRWINSQSSYHYTCKLPTGEWLSALRGTGGEYLAETWSQDMPKIGFAVSNDGWSWSYYADNPIIHQSDGAKGRNGIYRPLFMGYLGTGEYLFAWSESSDAADSDSQWIYAVTKDNFHTFERDTRGYGELLTGDGPFSAWREGSTLYLFIGNMLKTISIPTQ